MLQRRQSDGPYELIFEGLSSEDQQSLIQLRGALVADLGLSPERAGELLCSAPSEILVSDSRIELEPIRRRLEGLGARVSVRGDELVPAGSQNEDFELEFDLDEIGQFFSMSKEKNWCTVVYMDRETRRNGFCSDEEAEEVDRLLSSLTIGPRLPLGGVGADTTESPAPSTPSFWNYTATEIPTWLGLFFILWVVCVSFGTVFHMDVLQQQQELRAASVAQ